MGLDKERIWVNWKSDMFTLIEQTTLATLEQTKREIDEYFAFARALDRLPNLPISSHIAETAATVPLLDPNVTFPETDCANTEEINPAANDALVDSLQADLPGSGEDSTDSGAASAIRDADVEARPSDGVYPLLRNLVGGFAGPHFVPESAIRRLGFEEGDDIRVSYTGGTRMGGKPEYRYEIVSSERREPNVHRVEVELCLVTREEGRWMAGELAISDQDVGRFGIEIGDCVNVAYWKNNAGTARVVWKHPIDPRPRSTPKPGSVVEERSNTRRSPGLEISTDACAAPPERDAGEGVGILAPAVGEPGDQGPSASDPEEVGECASTVADSGYRGKKGDVARGKARRTPRRLPAKDVVAKVPEDSILSGKTVVVVSGFKNVQYYGQILEAFGAKPFRLTGEEPEATKQAILRKADAVILVTSAISHKAFYSVGDFCKSVGTPYRPTSRGGLQSVLRAATQALSAT